MLLILYKIAGLISAKEFKKRMQKIEGGKHLDDDEEFSDEESGDEKPKKGVKKVDSDDEEVNKYI